MAAGIADENTVIDIESIRRQLADAVKELLEKACFEPGDIFVLGCSSSEITGHRIGTFSSEEVGVAVWEEISKAAGEAGLFLAVQCCEHLNRSLIVEKECAKIHGLSIVNVVPQLKAGGSCSVAAYNGCESPVAVESLEGKSAIGMDIGDTLIGMHLRPVAVPVRTRIKAIGEANLVCARTRPKYVGGDRASYDETMA